MDLDQSQWPSLTINDATTEADDAFEKRMSSIKHAGYDFEVMPVNKASVSQKNAIKLFGDEPRFRAALRNLSSFLIRKNTEFKIDGIKLKCLREKEKNRPPQMSLTSEFFMQGNLNLTFSWDKKDGSSSLTIAKATGATFEHVQLMFDKIMFLLNGWLDKFHTKAALDSYVKATPKRILKKCDDCGTELITPDGVKRHRCDSEATFDMFHECDECQKRFITLAELQNHKKLVHKSQIVKCKKCPASFNDMQLLKLHIDKVHEVPPLKKDKVAPQTHTFTFKNIVTGKNESKNVRVIEKAVETGQIDIAPKVFEPKKSLNDYVHDNYPGHSVYDVVPDGACLPRACSAGLSGTQKHYELISRTRSKFYRDNWNSFKGSILLGSDSITRNVGVSGKKVKFLTKDQFLDFQDTEESTYLWGDYHDLTVYSEVIGVGIDCLVVENGVVVPSKTIHVDPQTIPVGFRTKQNFNMKRITLANLERSHFVAIVDSSFSEKRSIIEKCMRDLRNYINSPVNPDKKMDSEIKTVNADMNKVEKTVHKENASLCSRTLELEKMFEAMNKRFDMNEKELNVLKVDNKALNEQNDVLKQNMKGLHEQHEVLKQDIRNMKVKLDKTENEFKKLQEQMQISPESVEARSQESEMDIDETQDDNPNNQQIQVLQQQKRNGYKRISPAASPERKREHFVCDICGWIYEFKPCLEKHIQEQHLNSQNTVSVKPPEMRIETVVTNRTPKKVLQNVNGLRNYNCHECDFQGNSSKNLHKHLRENGHKGDPVSERCYTCNEACNNFDDLMIHRKNRHGDKINSCRYFLEGGCKYDESNCWYRHDPIKTNHVNASPTPNIQTKLPNNNQTKQNFHSTQDQFPPDQISQICAQLQNLVTGLTLLSSQQSKGDNQKRQRGL